VFHLPNVVLLTLPSEGDRAAYFREPGLIGRAIEALVAAWNPNWLAFRDVMVDIVDRPWTHGPAFGWINYLAPAVGTIRTLPTGWKWLESVRECPIFVNDVGLPSTDDAEHVRAYRRLMESVEWKSNNITGYPLPVPR
jgi:hypothetical protein